MKLSKTQKEELIFTTGAFLKPIKVAKASGEETWTWQVVEFVDDSYKNGHLFNPKEFADNINNLQTIISE
ncbi:MAG: hypothetical protein HOC71_07015 [Candidatus Latescibacteria bacterium]|jgi:hypothetical protein|nr:hypothetical protein [Candidatus Latescibacterota bacterium]